MALPEPEGAELPEKPPEVELGVGRRLVRIFNPARGGWDRQRFFGPVKNMRFDHHPPPTRVHETYSVWYAASSLRGAVAEAFGRAGAIDRRVERRIIRAEVRRPLRLLDLLGVSARALGLTQEIAAGTQYELTRRWALQLYESYPFLHGMRWRGREVGSINYLLDDRASMERLEGRDWALGDPAVASRIARAAHDCRIPFDDRPG